MLGCACMSDTRVFMCVGAAVIMDMLKNTGFQI